MLVRASVVPGMKPCCTRRRSAGRRIPGQGNLVFDAQAISTARPYTAAGRGLIATTSPAAQPTKCHARSQKGPRSWAVRSRSLSPSYFFFHILFWRRAISPLFIFICKFAVIFLPGKKLQYQTHSPPLRSKPSAAAPPFTVFERSSCYFCKLILFLLISKLSYLISSGCTGGGNGLRGLNFGECWLWQLTQRRYCFCPFQSPVRFPCIPCFQSLNFSPWHCPQSLYETSKPIRFPLTSRRLSRCSAS